MEQNVCGVDRLVRALLGIVLMSVLFRSRRKDATGRSISPLELLTVYATAELSVNVFARWCPLNAILGINTCENRRET